MLADNREKIVELRLKKLRDDADFKIKIIQEF